MASELTRRDFVKRAALLAALPLIPLTETPTDEALGSEAQADIIQQFYNACGEAQVELGDLRIAAKRWQRSKANGQELLELVNHAVDNGALMFVAAMAGVKGYDLLRQLYEMIEQRETVTGG